MVNKRLKCQKLEIRQFQKLWKKNQQKTKPLFMIYTDFESTSVPEDKTKESNINKYQMCVACSYGYRLACVNDKFSQPFKLYLGKDSVCNFINSMIEESKYFSDAMKKHFNKEHTMAKVDDKDFENSTKCWTCNNAYVDGNVKVWDQCHIEVQHIDIVISKLN